VNLGISRHKNLTQLLKEIKMNTKLFSAITVAIISSFAAAAHADESWPGPIVDTPSTVTRAEVRNEAVKALRDGQIAFGEAVPFIISTPSTVTRAEVRAEAVKALRDGQIAFGEAVPFIISTPADVKSRAQVVAETHEAIRLGLINKHEAVEHIGTPKQLEQIRLAGLRAVAVQMASR
jgi:Domain of unknown function (DUF4148)